MGDQRVWSAAGPWQWGSRAVNRLPGQAATTPSQPAAGAGSKLCTGALRASSASSAHRAGEGPLIPMEFAHLLIQPCSGAR